MNSNSHYRFAPLPRPSLRTAERNTSRRSICSCSSTYPSTETCSYHGGGYSNYPPQPPSPHVHFLNLCQTYPLDYEYDRSSTVVQPNECALPARGCPGKTFLLDSTRTGRRITRCGTPGPSRASSRSRNNMSPPPSPSFYVKHLFYQDESSRTPSPLPSPRIVAPQLIPDAVCQQHLSDDSDPGLSTPPEAAMMMQSSSSIHTRRDMHIVYPNGGVQPSIEAPGHPPIPGIHHHRPSLGRAGSSDLFNVTNRLNGLDIGGGYNPSERFAWSPSGNLASSSEATTPKKAKSKKQAKFVDDGHATLDPSTSSKSGSSSSSKRTRVSTSSWKADNGCLGGF